MMMQKVRAVISTSHRLPKQNKEPYHVGQCLPPVRLSNHASIWEKKRLRQEKEDGDDLLGHQIAFGPRLALVK